MGKGSERAEVAGPGCGRAAYLKDVGEEGERVRLGLPAFACQVALERLAAQLHLQEIEPAIRPRVLPGDHVRVPAQALQRTHFLLHLFSRPANTNTNKHSPHTSDKLILIQIQIH